MADINLEDMSFQPHNSGVRALFYKRYYFDISREELDNIGPWRLSEDGIIFDCGEKRAWNKMSVIIDNGMRRLRHILYNKPTVFISGETPLIGSNEFGICDRGTNIIEIKPLTGCNFNCVYCSVNEGRNNKLCDYLVELEHLLAVAEWIASTKRNAVEFNIGPQGEPLLYPKIVDLVKGLRKIKNVEVISINTNGSLLSKKLIDDLAEARLSRINLSLNALDQEVANKLAGTSYPLERVLNAIDYAQSRGINILLAPTLVPGFNDDQMEPLVNLSKSIKSRFPKIGIQNFLNYTKGRNPVKQLPWDRFYEMIDNLERRTDTSLRNSMDDFGIKYDNELPKPWRKGQTINAKVLFTGRYSSEFIAAAGEGRDARVITVVNGHDGIIGRRVSVRIVRDKHNIFKGIIK